MLKMILLKLLLICAAVSALEIKDETNRVLSMKTLARFILIPQSLAKRNGGNSGRVTVTLEHNHDGHINGTLWFLGFTKTSVSYESLVKGTCQQIIESAYWVRNNCRSLTWSLLK